MGRLFWKLFVAIFLAQVLTAAAVGVLLWIRHPPGMTYQRVPGSLESHPPPAALGPPGSHPPSWNAPDRPPPRPGLPWLPLGAGVISSLVLAYFVARHLARPILELRSAFAEVSRGNFKVGVAAKLGTRRDELAELGQDFDRTAAQLKALMDGRRRLLHDVSHEVRSPLARIQLAIDLADQQPERTAECLGRIGRDAQRIDALVGELLMLSRLEVRETPIQFAPLDLAELLREIVVDAQLEAQRKPCAIRLDAPDVLSCSGNEELLHRALENIIRNAIRHTPSATLVVVGLSVEQGAVKLLIEDEGPGLPEAALDAVFEPFTRVGGEIGSDGYGLGLAIARRTIEAHGGVVRASNRELGGLAVEVILPLARV